jgi:hypothetical protein
MSAASPVIFDGLQRPAVQGDLINSCDRVSSDATAASITWSVAQAMSTILSRSGPGAGYADVTPTSSEWINALLQGAYQGGGATTPLGVPVGFSYRFRVLSTVAFANTIVAGTGVTLAGVTAVAASSYRDYVVTVLNGTPAQQYSATTVNASAVVTGMTAAQTQNLSPGMLVTGAGIPAAATIASIQPGVGFTLSANATASASLVALTFLPRVEVRGIGGGLI